MEIIPLVGDRRYESFLDKSKQDMASSSELGEPWELPGFNQHHQNQMTNCHFGFNSKGNGGEI
ncbi:unnamed protein product [Prunus armeniaca]